MSVVPRNIRVGHTTKITHVALLVRTRMHVVLRAINAKVNVVNLQPLILLQQGTVPAVQAKNHDA